MRTQKSLFIGANLMSLVVGAYSCIALARDLPPGVVALQGGQQVTLQDIDALAQKIPENDRAGFFDSPKRIQSVITSLLVNKQLAAEARAAKLDQDPLVKRQMEQAIDGALAHVGLEQFRKNLKMPDMDELAQEYYIAHKDEFVVPGRIAVKHVLVSTKDRDVAESKGLIGKVEATARAHPDQFDALVEKYSDDPSKKDNHGLIEDAGSGKVAAAFAEAANALKTVGDISPIVTTEYGYHVLKLVERKPDQQKTFDEVKDDLVAKLRKDYIDRQVADHTDQLRNNPLDANPELVASLRTRFLPPGAVLPEDAAKAAADKAAAEKAPAEKAAVH